jgi:hypothetical protein
MVGSVGCNGTNNLSLADPGIGVGFAFGRRLIRFAHIGGADHGIGFVGHDECSE